MGEQSSWATDTRSAPARRGGPATYALAFGALAAAVALRYVLDPWMGDALPLVTLFGAIAAAVWVGGYRPAIVSALVGYAACSYLFIPPRGEIALFERGTFIGLMAYLFTCALIITFGEATRRAQQRASDRREVLLVTLRSIGDAVITTDVEGRITNMNEVAESLTGWTQAEAAGQPLDDVFRIVNEDTRRPVENPAAQALRSGTIVGLANHTVLIRRNGGEYPIDDSAAPIRDEAGNISGCVLIFRDVTAQRRSEKGRADRLLTARLLASIVESSDDAIISKSLDGTIQTWNAAAERLFGYAPDQAVGRHISLVIPPERLSEEDHIIACLKAGRRIEHFETERVRADGTRILVSLTISPLRDDAGTVVGASKIVRDVTRQRQIEQRERQLLSEADRRKNEFLAMLAHELRNPLASISYAARVLRLDGASPDARRSASEALERQIGQMTRLVDDLLDSSRISRGMIDLRREPVELAPIVEQAVESIRGLTASRGQQLTIAVPPQPIALHADPARLAQVIGNLLNNASKFTDAGGRLDLTVEQQGDEAVVRVSDTGIGISADDLPRIFDMFVQVDTSLERSRDGLGIGLTLVKTLVEMHGGTVEVSSRGLGQGSVFTVRLPVATAAPGPAAREAPAGADVPAGRRVLIVDDSLDGAESLAILLQFIGHETHLAHDGVTALEAAERLRPDAVLLDIGLPGLNGYEVCTRIRQQPWGKAVTLVALTGWGQDEDRHRSREAGFDAHLVKPVDHDALAALLAAAPRAGSR